jgi:hypothetical protein
LQANHHLRTIALVKQLWILLLTDLRTRSFIETPLSTLSEYTTLQLIDQVKTLVVGPRTWMVSADSNPQTSKEVTIPLGEPLRRPLATQLINGGRHIIIAAFPYSVLEIWDVGAKQRVWSRDGVFIFSLAREIEDDMLIVATQSRDSSWCVTCFLTSMRGLS